MLARCWPSHATWLWAQNRKKAKRTRELHSSQQVYALVSNYLEQNIATMLRAVGIVLPIPKVSWSGSWSETETHFLRGVRHPTSRSVCWPPMIFWVQFSMFSRVRCTKNLKNGCATLRLLRLTMAAVTPWLKILKLQETCDTGTRVKIQTCWNLQFSFNNNLKPFEPQKNDIVIHCSSFLSDPSAYI